MGNEGKKRVRKSPEERKKEIIAAASRLIGEKGYYGTSLKDIADAIGMSQPGLLHYIGNKERLLSLLVTDNYDQEGTPADLQIRIAGQRSGRHVVSRIPAFFGTLQ